MPSSEDMYIHEYRFSDWMPSPIKSLAADPFSGIVAIGREDGTVELTNPNGRWYNQARVCGRTDFQLSGLEFSRLENHSGRLFGASMHGFVFENIRDSYGGAIWNICAGPRDGLLGLGCEDGSAKLFTYVDSGLDYVRSMQPTGSRVLCLCFDPSEPRLFAGCADGTIRAFNEATGVSLFRMTGDASKGLPTAIWSLHVTRDCTVVSGDNKGQLQFWNGSTGDEMLGTIQQHTAPILAICSSPEGDRVFASGVDSRVICVNRLGRGQLQDDLSSRNDGADPSRWKWVYASAHRPHSHDVQALIVVPPLSLDVVDRDRDSLVPGPILISGSVDCKLCSYSVNDFVGCRPSWVLPVPARGLVSMDEACSVAAVKHREYVDIWRLSRRPVGEPPVMRDTEAGRDTDQARLAARLQLMAGVGRDHIHSVAVSPAGDVVAVSGGSADGGSAVASGGLRLWQLTADGEEEGVKRLTLPRKVLEATSGDVECQAMCFSGDGRCLAVAAAATGTGHMEILLLDVNVEGNSSSDEECVAISLRHKLQHSRSLQVGKDTPTLDSKLSAAVDMLAFSADGRWLAISSCGTRLCVYEVDRLALHWVLPTFSSAVSCAAFHPASANSLLVTLSGDNAFLIFDVQDKALSPWSRANTTDVPRWSECLNRSTVGPIYNVAFDPSNVTSFVLYGQAFSVCVDLDERMPAVVGPSAASLSEGRMCVPVPYDSRLAENDAQPMLGAARLPLNRRENKKRKQMEKLLTNGSSVIPAAANGGKDLTSDRAAKAPRPNRNYKVIKMRSVVQLSMVSRQEIVVVENPWVRILENMPDILARKRYAT